MTVGIIGLVLAVFFYLHSRREREPYFYIQPTRTSIVDRGLAVGERLKILYDNQPLKATNVTAMQMQFWNAGREPIRRSDVLLPIRMTFPKGGEILDLTVVKQSRPDIVQFKATTDKGQEELRSNTATFDFSILEQDDGATLQVVYAGGPELPVIIDGAIIGARITKLTVPLEDSRKSRPPWSDVRFFKVTILVYIFFPVFVFGVLPRPSKIRDASFQDSGTSKEKMKFLDFSVFKRRRFWALQLVWTVLLLSLYYYLFRFSQAVPPSLVR